MNGEMPAAAAIYNECHAVLNHHLDLMGYYITCSDTKVILPRDAKIKKVPNAINAFFATSAPGHCEI